MKEFENRKTFFFENFSKIVPEHEFIVGYGSGVFYQKDSKLDRMIDIILVVENIEQFHKENIKMNRSHYHFSFSPTDFYHRKKIEVLQNNLFPLFYFTQNKFQNVAYKYGVIQKDVLYDELSNWTNFTIA